MNATIRKVLTATSLSRKFYFKAREAYHTRRISRSASKYFLNADAFKRALNAQGVTAPLDLRTADGLTITIRQNYGDAMTVAEIFLEDCYGRALNLPRAPVVIDVGGFIGDFSLYAVKRLNAKQVIVCEPSPRNWKLLLKNIANNGYEDRIQPLNKAVTQSGEDVMLNIDAPDECQCMVSEFGPSDQPLSSVSGISLSQIFKEYAVENADLLKIDIEGGEYAILENTPSEIYARISNILFEYHNIDGAWDKLERVKKKLRQEGYSLNIRQGLVSASRP